MITFFTHCRPFEGEFDALQRRAMTSWAEAVPGCEVIDVTGRVETNERGTALVSSIFEVGEREASNDLLCEISSDIILSAGLSSALDVIREVERPFVVGRRIDRAADGMESIHGPYAVDYFIYRRGTLGEIPPFAVGRTAYDNWLVWAALEPWGLQVIDATQRIVAVHPEHGEPVYGSRAKMLQSEERARNLELFQQDCDRVYGIDDAPYVLTSSGVQRR